MQRVRTLWNRGLLGKIILIVAGFTGILVLCCIVGLFIAPAPPSPQTNGSRATPAPLAIVATEAATTSAESPPTPAPAMSPTPEPSATPLPSPTPLPAIGQEVKVGNVIWKVTKARAIGKLIKSGNQFIPDLVTSGHFVDLRYEITNTSDSALTIGRADLLDTRNRRFSPGLASQVFIDEPCNTEASLNPGLSTSCEAIYDVPNDATGLRFEATGADGPLFGSEPVLIDLGL